MQLLVAIIKPFKADDLAAALAARGIHRFMMSDVRGFGRQLGRTELYRGAEYAIEFLPKTKLEVVVRDDQVAEIVDLIRGVCGTGRFGDGKVMVAPVRAATRIATGESGPAVLDPRRVAQPEARRRRRGL